MPQSYIKQKSEVLAQKQIYGSMGQNREPEINSHTYGQLTFNKGSKNITMWKR